MRRWMAVTRALPTTFAVYVVTTVFALGLGVSLGIELESAFANPTGRPLTRVLIIERLWHMTPLLRAKAFDLLFAVIALLSLAPWLKMSWFASLSALHGPGRAFGSGRTFYGRALLTSLLLICAAAMMMIPWALMAYGAHSFLEGRASDRVHDITVVITLVPIVPSLLIALAWHDIAHGRCLTTGAFRSVLSAAPDALRPSVMVRFIGWGCLGFAVVLIAQWIASRATPEGPIGNLLVVALTQSTAFLRTVVRSAWLTDVLVTIDEAEAAKARNQR